MGCESHGCGLDIVGFLARFCRRATYGIELEICAIDEERTSFSSGVFFFWQGDVFSKPFSGGAGAFSAPLLELGPNVILVGPLLTEQ